MSQSPFAPSRPAVLRSVLAPKPWGWERWLTSTRPEAPAGLEGAPGTLAEHIAAHPEVLGTTSRRLFGDTLPLFTKLVHTGFAQRVHLGFARPVERALLLEWLVREQARMRELFGALRTPDAQAFAAYEARYSAWATAQALAGWRRDDDVATASALRDFIDPAFALPAWLKQVRESRAEIADTLNEIDLAEESGSLFLASAGTIHAIFGLSLQTHPRDRARGALQALFAALTAKADTGADDAALTRILDESGLDNAIDAACAPPKNEAWLPLIVEGDAVIVEPQQSSDTTYSLADVYTPLVWDGARPRFRKGSPTEGLSREALTTSLADLDVDATSIDAIRRRPIPLAHASRPGALLSRLVDEPAEWPFFTAYQLDLTEPVTLAPPSGVCQQLVVTRGRLTLGDAIGPVGELSPQAPGFIPATLAGPCTLTPREPSTVLVFAPPGLRGGAPRL